MIPTYINPEVKSSAERKIYGAIKNAALADFVCFHSLGLSRHLWKRQGEIDFVLVGGNAIICLEVKGGRISRKDGVWYFTNRFGQESKKAESPFAQASSAMFSLKANLEAQFGHMGMLFGYGVLMPDIKFSISSPEWDDEIVYDLNDTQEPFERYIHRLRIYWEKKVGMPSPRVAEKEVVQYLRGDFELPTPLWQEIQNTEDQVVNFTSEQYRALDHMESNPRLIFSGGAGSGKTLLAVEKARRAALDGKHVLLLCYNKFLGSKLKSEVAKFANGAELVHVDSIHKYFAKVIASAGLKKELDRRAASAAAQEIYDGVFADLFVKAAGESSFKKFDLLVVDEGQDILNENYLLAFDEVLEGGMQKGCWVIFLDPGAQARLFNKFSLEAYNYLKSTGVPEYRLDMNCRNTVQIAKQTSVVSGFPTGIARVIGPKVEYITYKDGEDQVLKIVRLARDLIENEGVPPECITILSTKAKNSMPLFTSGVRVPGFFEELDENNIIGSVKGKVGIASVQAYKGLENNVIVYCDVDRLGDKWIEGVNYVGMTRAKEKLYVFLHKKARKEYETRILNYATHKQKKSK